MSMKRAAISVMCPNWSSPLSWIINRCPGHAVTCMCVTVIYIHYATMNGWGIATYRLVGNTCYYRFSCGDKRVLGIMWVCVTCVDTVIPVNSKGTMQHACLIHHAGPGLYNSKLSTMPVCLTRSPILASRTHKYHWSLNQLSLTAMSKFLIERPEVLNPKLPYLSWMTLTPMQT